MKRFILSYLHFSRRERLGTVVLTFICAAVFALPDILHWCYPRKTTDFSRLKQDIQAFRYALQFADSINGESAYELFFFDPNIAQAGDFVRLGLTEKVAQTICNYREKGGKFRKPEDFQKIWSLPPDDYERLLPYIRIETGENERAEPKQVAAKFELFAFDPNTASESELLRLGLPQRTVKSILNYRAKGGAFRKKDDFRKIYSLKEEDYARLEPAIIIGGAIASAESSRPVAYSGGNHPSLVAVQPLDINRADEEAWQRLPGIGEKRAAQIVRYRASLGGFLSIEQLGDMYGLPDSVFQKIRPLLVLTSAEVKKINLNKASETDLDKHPYISVKQAKLIVAYRDQHGQYASVDDLSKIAAFSDKKWLEKVRPYLEAQQ